MKIKREWLRPKLVAALLARRLRPSGASASSASRSSSGGSGSLISSVYMIGTTNSVSAVEVSRPPTTARASGMLASLPRLPTADGHREQVEEASPGRSS